MKNFSMKSLLVAVICASTAGGAAAQTNSYTNMLNTIQTGTTGCGSRATTARAWVAPIPDHRNGFLLASGPCHAGPPGE